MDKGDRFKISTPKVRVTEEELLDFERREYEGFESALRKHMEEWSRRYVDNNWRAALELAHDRITDLANQVLEELHRLGVRLSEAQEDILHAYYQNGGRLRIVKTRAIGPDLHGLGALVRNIREQLRKYNADVYQPLKVPNPQSIVGDEDAAIVLMRERLKLFSRSPGLACQMHRAFSGAGRRLPGRRWMKLSRFKAPRR